MEKRYWARQDLRGRGMRAAVAATATAAVPTAAATTAATAAATAVPAAAAAPLPQRRRLQLGTKSAASGMSWND